MFLGIVLLILLYFVPTFIAAWRQSRHTLLAVMLNIALGWTIIGWIVALVLALMRREGSFAGPAAFPTTGLPTGGMPLSGGPYPGGPYPAGPAPDTPPGFTRE
jgi:hypothetical protein